MTLVKETSREHYEKYETLTQLVGVSNLLPLVPAGAQELEQAFLKDPHLNSIPLSKWDLIKPVMGQDIIKSPYDSPYMSLFFRKIKERGSDKKITLSISDIVCTLKHVAVYHVLKAEPKFREQ